MWHFWCWTDCQNFPVRRQRFKAVHWEFQLSPQSVGCNSWRQPTAPGTRAVQMQGNTFHFLFSLTVRCKDRFVHLCFFFLLWYSKSNPAILITSLMSQWVRLGVKGHNAEEKVCRVFDRHWFGCTKNDWCLTRRTPSATPSENSRRPPIMLCTATILQR